MTDPTNLPVRSTPMPLPPPVPEVVLEAPPDPVEQPSANAPVTGRLVCTTVGCSHQGHSITVHADTVLPIHCGGCFGVLHCEHDNVTEQVREGTIGAPLLRTTTKCRLCGTVASETRDELEPIDLTTLPAAILDQPLAPGRVH